MTDALETKTVTELKQLCKARNLTGYSKLKKEELIGLLSAGASPETPVDQGARAKPKTVYSREESDKKVDKNKHLLEQRAAVAGLPVEMVKEDATPKPEPTINKPVKGKGKTRPAAKKPLAVKAVIQSPGTGEASHGNDAGLAAPVDPTLVEASHVDPLPDVETSPQRFQDLPSSERAYVLKNKISKNALKLLKLGRSDFLKMKPRKMEDILDALEIEKGRFSVYNPTERMLRDFIDESISLINDVREEQLNMVERNFLNHDLPKYIKKNEKKVKEIISKVDQYYTEIDAARDIVTVLRIKSPFPESYWVAHFKEHVLTTRASRGKA